MAGRARDLTVKGNGHHGDVPGVLAPLARRVNPGRTSPPVDRDPAFIERSVPWVRALTSYFSPEVRGVENLPAEGPVLIVGDPNAVFYMPDMWVTALAIVGRRGFEQPTYAMAYDLVGWRPGGGRPSCAASAPSRATRRPRGPGPGGGGARLPGRRLGGLRPWLGPQPDPLRGPDRLHPAGPAHGVRFVPVVAHGSHDSIVVAFPRGERTSLGALRVSGVCG